VAMLDPPFWRPPDAPSDYSFRDLFRPTKYTAKTEREGKRKPNPFPHPPHPPPHPPPHCSFIGEMDLLKSLLFPLSSTTPPSGGNENSLPLRWSSSSLLSPWTLSRKRFPVIRRIFDPPPTVLPFNEKARGLYSDQAVRPFPDPPQRTFFFPCLPASFLKR